MKVFNQIVIGMLVGVLELLIFTVLAMLVCKFPFIAIGASILLLATAIGCFTRYLFKKLIYKFVNETHTVFENNLDDICVNNRNNFNIKELKEFGDEILGLPKNKLITFIKTIDPDVKRRSKQNVDC